MAETVLQTIQQPVEMIQLREATLIAPEMSPYALHQWLWERTTGGRHADRAGGRQFLYRADPITAGWFVHIRLCKAATGDLKTQPVTYVASEGTQFAFELRTVPVRRSGHRVVEVFTGEAAVDWLATRAEHTGFTLETPTQAFSRAMTFHGKHGRRITLNDTLFHGKLLVTNTARLAKTLRDGIGRHKGFGFGLLQLKHTEE